MAEPHFVIQGVEYPAVGWDSFDMDEAEILSAKTGLTLMDLSQGEIQLTPGVLSTMMIVAYMRGNPNVTRARAEQVIGKVKLLDALEHLATEDDAVPPSQTPQPDENESSGASNESTGTGSSNDSDDPPVADPVPIGTFESGMSRTSDLRASAS